MCEMIRCDWAEKHKLDRDYHDKEWGRPVHDDRHLFKMLMLEGKQAGLSWHLILKRREALCAAFDDFDPAALITYDEKKVEELLQTEGVIRNRLKINAVISNAKAYFELCKNCGSLDSYLWSYVEFRPIQNAWKTQSEIPAKTGLSDVISKDMKKRGFKFVGSTILYAYMQSIGMVNDHLTGCALYPVVRELGTK